VIADDEASIATWIEPGTRIAYPLGLAPDGSLINPDTWTVELRDWFGSGCLDLTPAADAAHAEAEHVLDEWPFPTGWEEWRPPPAWTPLQLPEGCDVV
jgi:hypothetical protein